MRGKPNTYARLLRLRQFKQKVVPDKREEERKKEDLKSIDDLPEYPDNFVDTFETSGIMGDY